jgi:DNA-binding CsgD family transcriptional regulator
MEPRDNLTRREREVFQQILGGTLPRDNFTQREYDIVQQILDGSLPREVGGVDYGTPMILQHHVRAIYIQNSNRALFGRQPFEPSKEMPRAFAIAVSALQKRGLLHKGSVSLTAAGRREEEKIRAKYTPEELRLKEQEYESYLKEAKSKKKTRARSSKARKNPSAEPASDAERRFLRGYKEAAVWVNEGSNGVSDRLEESMLKDARAFLKRAELMIPNNEMDRAGFDFWLTRNREGAGFWDGFWGEDGDALTDIAHEFGEVDVFVGDDGLLHG